MGLPPSICERARLWGDLGVPCLEGDLEMTDGALGSGELGITRARPRAAAFKRSSWVGAWRYGENARF